MSDPLMRSKLRALKHIRDSGGPNLLRVRKSTDPIETLYAEIEKARGMIRGGSSKMRNRADAAFRHGHGGKHSDAALAHAKRYLGNRAAKGYYWNKVVGGSHVLRLRDQRPGKYK